MVLRFAPLDALALAISVTHSIWDSMENEDQFLQFGADPHIRQACVGVQGVLGGRMRLANET